MKKVFQSEDGKMFESESECAAYEAVIKNAERFEKSRFFTRYGSELEKYDWHTDIIYIAPDEFEKMQVYLRRNMRDLREYSASNVYYLSCMTFYPIEHEIEKEKRQLKRVKENIKDLERVQKSVIEKVDGLI